ncbi:hypothetical protein K2173_005353 [Erythroxylum novogranatense]|uniref:Uncharacterized protein n=1 Tax=Erythroxylum novogranatense TaxID=1862640 RepID=A0AAV8S6G3_9ROSI|nr:hypothetical protein K2173_005353 [Erythroxylum novogranatense]
MLCFFCSCLSPWLLKHFMHSFRMNLNTNLVNSYLKQHAPKLQGRYLELMLAMNENGISGNLQNEMIQIYLSEVLDWHSELSAQQKWNEKTFSPTRRKLFSTLETLSG